MRPLVSQQLQLFLDLSLNGFFMTIMDLYVVSLER